MMRFGDRARFAVEIGEFSDDSRQLRRVDLWAAGRWLTCDDHWAYLPAFCNAVQHTVTSVTLGGDLELPFSGLCAADTHRRFLAADDEAGQRFRTLDWGPTTDNVLAMLFRLGPDHLALTFRFWRETHHDLDERETIFTAEMPESEFVRVLAHAIGALSQNSAKVVLLTPTEYGESARALARYFRRLEDDHTPAWTTGRRAAEAWAQLIEDPARRPADLARCDELVVRGAGETDGAWVELTALYYDWRAGALAPTITDPRS